MDRHKETTQMLGRFQPWHQGHTELFKRAISKTGQVVILLREQDGTEKNPFTLEQRKEQIVEELKKEGYEYNNNYEIINVPNITHITYGRDVGYKIEQEHFDKDIEEISATKIREKLLDENSDTG